MVKQKGLPKVERSPYKSGFGTFFGLLSLRSCPLIPFFFGPCLLDQTSASIPRAIVTAATFFLMGSAKSKWSLVVRWKSAVKTLSIGMGAAGINLKWLFA